MPAIVLGKTHGRGPNGIDVLGVEGVGSGMPRVRLGLPRDLSPNGEIPGKTAKRRQPLQRKQRESPETHTNKAKKSQESIKFVSEVHQLLVC